MNEERDPNALYVHVAESLPLQAYAQVIGVMGLSMRIYAQARESDGYCTPPPVYEKGASRRGHSNSWGQATRSQAQRIPHRPSVGMRPVRAEALEARANACLTNGRCEQGRSRP